MPLAQLDSDTGIFLDDLVIKLEEFTVCSCGYAVKAGGICGLRLGRRSLGCIADNLHLVQDWRSRKDVEKARSEL